MSFSHAQRDPIPMQEHPLLSLPDPSLTHSRGDGSASRAGAGLKRDWVDDAVEGNAVGRRLYAA